MQVSSTTRGGRVVELILGSRIIFLECFIILWLWFKKKLTVYIVIHNEPLLRDDDDKKSVLECVIGVN